MSTGAKEKDSLSFLNACSALSSQINFSLHVNCLSGVVSFE